jgi:hypothetical protein
MAIMTFVGSPVDEWHGVSNAACRDVESNSSWIAAQLGGGLKEHFLKISSTLNSQTALKECGFFWFESMHGQDRAAMEFDDEAFAILMGNLTRSLLGLRVRRLLYFTNGWPGKSFKLLLPRPVPEAAIEEFRKDLDVYTALSAIEPRPRDLEQMLARSPFKLTVNKQWAAAFADAGWKVHEDTTDLARTRSKAVIGTQVIEDAFGVQKKCLPSPRQQGLPEA